MQCRDVIQRDGCGALSALAQIIKERSLSFFFALIESFNVNVFIGIIKHNYYNANNI